MSGPGGVVTRLESRGASRTEARAVAATWSGLTCGGGTRLRLLADHLDADLARARPVELREDDGLEPAERQLAGVDPDGDVSSEQGGPEVRVRVAPLAVGDARVVVAVAVPLRDEPLDEPLQVVDQRALELVDEQGAGGVQRVDERDARGDRELLDRIPDELGDVRDLGALLTRQRERGAENLHRNSLRGASPWIRRQNAGEAAPKPTVTITTHCGKSQPMPQASPPEPPVTGPDNSCKKIQGVALDPSAIDCS